MKASTTHIACGLMAVAFAVFAGAVSAEVPEPQTYWMGPLHNEVPATLSGAKVIHAPDLDALLRDGRAVLVDAASVPHRPENLAPETIWKPVPHENIAGSISIPGIREGNIDKNIEAYFRDRLSALTGNDLDRARSCFTAIRIAGRAGTRPSARWATAIAMSSGIGTAPKAGRMPGIRWSLRSRKRHPKLRIDSSAPVANPAIKIRGCSGFSRVGDRITQQGAGICHCDHLAYPNAMALACATHQTGARFSSIKVLALTARKYSYALKNRTPPFRFRRKSMGICYSGFCITWLGMVRNIHNRGKQTNRRLCLRYTHIYWYFNSSTSYFSNSFNIALRRPPIQINTSQWYRLLANSLYFLIYVSLILILISGYFQAIFRGAQVEFWGLRMPTWDAVDRPAADLFGKFWGAPFRIWGATDVTSAAFFGAVDDLFAFVLVGLIFAYIGCFSINKFRQPRPATPMLSLSTQPQEDAGQTTPPITANVVRGLAKNLRLFGWVEFWLQAVFAVFTALLLEFATSGRAFSPGASGFGDAIYWGADGFLLLLLAVFLAFYYTRAARKIASKPDSYLSKRGLITFWFLFAGLITSLLGILVSFVGVALSISLLIAKTVSQPPGIAITDPSKIIRALDVFILLVNCNLLMAHFIGAGIALWLGLSVLSARLKFVTIARRLD